MSSSGKIILVDDCDYDHCVVYKWNTVGRKGEHVSAYIPGSAKSGKRKLLYLHHLIISRIGIDRPDGVEVDHIDRNPLNNQRNNLRLADRSQQRANQSISKSNTSGVKGVIFDKSRNKYRAEVCMYGKRYYLGRFDNIIEAANAYRAAAEKIQGEFAAK